MKIAVIQGPNLNMLGIREKNIYGIMTLDQIHTQMKIAADQNNVEIEFFQSNYEGEIVDRIQECLGTADGIIINPAAYSHSSIAIKDALSSISIPTVEVHISNIYQREEYRQKSITASACAGIISGFGAFGYHLALISIIQIVNEMQSIISNQNKKEDK